MVEELVVLWIGLLKLPGTSLASISDTGEVSVCIEPKRTVTGPLPATVCSTCRRPAKDTEVSVSVTYEGPLNL